MRCTYINSYLSRSLFSPCYSIFGRHWVHPVFTGATFVRIAVEEEPLSISVTLCATIFKCPTNSPTCLTENLLVSYQQPPRVKTNNLQVLTKNFHVSYNLPHCAQQRGVTTSHFQFLFCGHPNSKPQMMMWCDLLRQLFQATVEILVKSVAMLRAIFAACNAARQLNSGYNINVDLR